MSDLALRIRFVLVVVAGFIGMVMAQGPMAQDPAYHRFADHRSWLGIPNTLDVLSNLAFALVGVAGLGLVYRRWTALRDPWTGLPYTALFLGTLLTAFGSAYYHWRPDDAHLVWDRVPMSLAFAGLLAVVLAERVSGRWARRIFVPALLLAPATVAWWYASGDLRPYVIVQFGTLLAVTLIVLLLPADRGRDFPWLAALGLYAIAKGLELGDAALFDATGLVSGHTLKHLVAAGGLACLWWAIPEGKAG